MAEVTEVIPELRDVDLDKIKPNGFVNTDSLNRAIELLKEVKIYVDKLLDIRDKTELPKILNQRIDLYTNELWSYIGQIEKVHTDPPDVVARKKENLIKEIRSYYSKCFDVEGQNQKSILEYYAIAASFDKPKDIEIKKSIEELENRINKTLLDSSNLVDSLNDKTNESETILEELKKKVSQQTVSDYALVYEEQAENHKKLAEKWLLTGIIISIAFILLITISALYEFLPTERLSATGIVNGYNISNIITKALIIAVIIFLLSFSFKQYSVNRHLQALNTQRQKALNSYKLFIASISADDINSRNALMIQVAKAIYEPQTTGFLSEKGQNVNSGIIELTKIIGQTKT